MPSHFPYTPSFWLHVIGAFIATEVVMVGCAFAWVFIYSVTLHTTGDAAYYEAYARTASPVVAVVMAFPVFFAAGRWLSRLGALSLAAALWVVGINLALDAAVIATAAFDPLYVGVLAAAAAVLKAVGAWLGSTRRATSSA